MKKMIHFVNNAKVDRRPSLDVIHLALHFVEFHSCQKRRQLQCCCYERMLLLLINSN